MHVLIQPFQFPVNASDMKKWSGPLKMDYKEFVRETTKALTCDCVNSLHFEYLVTPVDSSKDVSFVWKKCVPQESVKVGKSPFYSSVLELVPSFAPFLM